MPKSTPPLLAGSVAMRFTYEYVVTEVNLWKRSYVARFELNETDDWKVPRKLYDVSVKYVVWPDALLPSM
jgi:hypothetical protein